MEAAGREATEFLAELMDRYHDRIVVYEDVSSAGNHFVTFGKIPDENAPVEVNGSWPLNPHSGATAIRFSFTGSGLDFGGCYFLNGVLRQGAVAPLPNFGEVPNAGMDLSGAEELVFWARGEEGSEVIDFFVAGVGRDGETGARLTPFPGSSARHPPYGHTLALTREWQRFSIDLAGLDLSYVLGGFGWAASAEDNPDGAVFYVDDIEYTLDAAAREARLEEPRFLLSYVTLPVQPDPFDENPTDDLDLVLRNVAFSYDNALALLAFLAKGSPDNLERARILGDAFVYAAGNDRFFNDGPIRTAYAAGDIALPPGWTSNGRSGTVPVAGFYSEDRQTFFEVEQEAVDVGNNAWSMIALLALYRATLDSRYLDTALRIGDLIRTFRNETGTYQGYQGGVENPESASPELRPWASSEHNIDVFAAFRAGADATGNPQWDDGAEHARAFVENMWDEGQECFLAGTLDPANRNSMAGQLPVDVQAWSLIAGIPLARSRSSAVLDCAEVNHRTTDAGFGGFDFNQDRDGVWFEGTAHMALAHAIAGNEQATETLRPELRRAQDTAPFGQDGGLSAATRDGLTTGFGFEFYRRPHTGATAWLVFAQLGKNPFHLRW